LVTGGRILQNGPFEKQGVGGLMWIRIGVTAGGGCGGGGYFGHYNKLLKLINRPKFYFQLNNCYFLKKYSTQSVTGIGV
jgi:hypothetical protein